jgi:hypothetical protein
MQDDYDFEQLFQPLGNWDIEQHRASYDIFGCLIWNSDFRKWRDRTGMGGDFEVYSDLKVTHFNPPLVFTC